MSETTQLQLHLTAKDEATKALKDVSLALGFEQAKQGLGELSSKLRGPIEDATALGESVNAVQRIFGESSKVVLKWGDDSARAYGLSERAFNQMATPLGAALKNLGFSQAEVAEQTINLTKRASDLASVFNTDVEDALTAIQAALRGEADPIERYGVSVNAAAVANKALAMTGKEAASELTDQEKAAARLALIMEQTAAVEGDFAATSGQLANAQRVMNASIEEGRTALISHLLPALEIGVTTFAGLPPEIQGATAALVEFGPSIAQTTVGLLAMGPALGKAAQTLPTLTRNALAAGPAIAGIGLAFGAALLAADQFSDNTPEWNGALGELTDKSDQLAFLQAKLADATGVERIALEELIGRVEEEIEAEKEAAEFKKQLEEATKQVTEEVNVFGEALQGTKQVLTGMTAVANEAFGALNKFKSVPTEEQLQLESSIARVRAELERQKLALIDGTAAQAGNEAAVEANIEALEAQLDVLGQQKTVLDAERDATIAMGASKLAASGQVAGLTQTEDELRQKVMDASNAMSDQEGRARNLTFTLDGLIGKMNAALRTGDLMTAQEQLLLVGVQGYDHGGVIPGPIGAPRLIMAHGGETVLPTHKPENQGMSTGGGVVVNVQQMTVMDPRRDTGPAGDVGWAIVSAARKRGLAV